MPSFAGIDIGNNNCKIALRDGETFRLVNARLPQNMVEDSEVTSSNMMSDYLRKVRSEEGIHERNAALVLAESKAFFRHVALPPMTIDELTINLPYEFRDFVSEDLGEYIYDYAVDEMVYGEEGNLERMELYVSAVSKKLIEEYDTVLRKAGFKLKMVVPAQMAYTRLLEKYIEDNPSEAGKGVVLVDIGHDDVSISLHSGAKFKANRTVDFGCDEFDYAISELKGIDPYTASSYKFTNFEGVLDTDECQALCQRFALEVSRVINFYNFNNPENEIEQMYFLGGGAQIKQLTDAISEAVSIPSDRIDALLPPGARGQEFAPVCALAIAGVMESEAI